MTIGLSERQAPTPCRERRRPPWGRTGVSGLGAAAVGAVLALSTVSPASAEWYGYGYMGQAATLNSDFRIEQPTLGNDFTFSGVSFDDDSFKSPYYYGVKIGRYFESHPNFGLEMEFFHYKLILDTAKTAPVSGTLGGAALGGSMLISNLVGDFEISHGLNFLALNVVGRLRYWKSNGFPNGRFQPYGGIGIAAVIMYPEVVVLGVSSHGFELNDRPGTQFFIGARLFPLDLGPSFGNLALFAEYKFTVSHPEVSVDRGTASLNERTHHFIFGLGWHF